VERLETTVVAGNVVELNCTMNASCFDQSFLWRHYSAFNSWGEIWSFGYSLNPRLMVRRVNVDSDTANGRSVLTIPRARLTDAGIFYCLGYRHRYCRM